jgi:hypothetical protein
MSVSSAAPVRWRSRPGTNVMMGEPGLKPSLRFHSAGSTGTPAAFLGIDSAARSMRLPVSVEPSRTVK